MCQLTKSTNLDLKLLIVFSLVMLFHSVGYRFLIINSGVPDMHVGTIMDSRDATFFESEFSMKNAPNTTSHESIIPHE